MDEAFEEHDAIEQLVAEIEAMDLDGLRGFWRARYGAPPSLRSTPLLRRLLAWRVGDGEVIRDRTSDCITVSLPVLFAPRGSRTLVLPAMSRPRQPDLVLIAALRKAHAMLRTERGMPIIDSAPRPPYDRAILRLAFLAPDIQCAILEGRQPTHLNLEWLKGIDVPLAWSKQRNMLGFASCRTSCSGEQIT